MAQEPIKELKVGNKILRIFNDDMADSPLSWSNIGKLICFHKRYDLGDKHEYNHEQYDSYAEMEKDIVKKENAAIILPLYLYDHSCITIRTTSFNDRWDSGQVGFAIVTKETIKKEYSVKRISKKLLADVTSVLLGEIETYDQFIRGDVYRFEIVKLSVCDHEHEHEEHEDSCGGFFGDDFKNNGITDHVGEEFAELLKAT